jgi:uncharacterized protein YegL
MISAEPKVLPVFVLADVSGSMAADGKIDALNQSMKDMIETFKEPGQRGTPIKLAVIVFSGSDARLHIPFTAAKSVDWEDLQAGGGTPMGAALAMLTSLVEDRNVIKSKDYRPMVILASDGQPTDDFASALETLNKSERAKKADRFALAIGMDADTEVLKRFTDMARKAEEAQAVIFRAGDANQIRKAFKEFTMSASNRSSHNDPDKPAEVNSGNLQTVN